MINWHRPRFAIGRRFIVLGLAVASLGFVGLQSIYQVEAQTFIQPPAAPPGGNSAAWITTGPADERKLGSLLLGSSTTTSTLCLNAANENVSAKCITSWSDVLNLAGGPFVPLRTSGVAAPIQSEPLNYFNNPATGLGAAVIQGSGPAQAYSLIAEANPDVNAGYGLFAGDGGATSNSAAQFSGRVGIGNTILSSGALGPAGQFCLDTTAPYVANGATGCITAWGDLSLPVLSGYVRLQAANPPTPEAGTAAASDIGNFGAVTFGHAPVGLPALTFCGDGMCSDHLDEDVSGANYCPIDCSQPNPPTNITVISTTTTGANLSLVGPAQLPAGNIYVVVARSTNPTFINDVRSAFVPQNGVSYSKGQIINGVSIAEARSLTPGASGYTFALSDGGLTTKTTYYYRLYQANLFPIYNTAPKTVSATTQ